MCVGEGDISTAPMCDLIVKNNYLNITAALWSRESVTHSSEKTWKLEVRTQLSWQSSKYLWLLICSQKCRGEIRDDPLKYLSGIKGVQESVTHRIRSQKKEAGGSWYDWETKLTEQICQGNCKLQTQRLISYGLLFLPLWSSHNAALLFSMYFKC